MVEQCDGGGGDDDEGRRDGETGRRGDGGIVVPLVGSGGTSPTSSAGRWGNGTGANGRASPLYVVSASFPIRSLAGGRSPLSLPGRRDGCAPEGKYNDCGAGISTAKGDESRFARSDSPLQMMMMYAFLKFLVWRCYRRNNTMIEGNILDCAHHNNMVDIYSAVSSLS
jgi:hypothetical protein